MNRLLLFRGKLMLGKDSTLKKVLLKEFHQTPMGGHAGIQRTYIRSAANFFWEGMKKDVKEFFGQCFICQTIKYSTEKPYGLLLPTKLSK